MTVLATCRDGERAAEVRLAQLLFSGACYRSDEHIAACAALEAARNATNAAKCQAAAAAFGCVATPVPTPQPAAKPRRSRRIAAAAAARVTKEQAAAADASEIDAYLAEEEAALKRAASAASKKEKISAKLQEMRARHVNTWNHAQTMLDSYKSGMDDMYAEFKKNPVDDELRKRLKSYSNLYAYFAKIQTNTHHKIQAIDAQIAAL